MSVLKRVITRIAKSEPSTDIPVIRTFVLDILADEEDEVGGGRKDGTSAERRG